MSEREDINPLDHPYRGRVPSTPSKVAEAVRDACADALSRRVIPDDMSLAMARSAIHDLDLNAILAKLGGSGQ